eukprot:4525053-Amphidinium_carterae.1
MLSHGWLLSAAEAYAVARVVGVVTADEVAAIDRVVRIVNVDEVAAVDRVVRIVTADEVAAVDRVVRIVTVDEVAAVDCVTDVEPKAKNIRMLYSALKTEWAVDQVVSCKVHVPKEVMCDAATAHATAGQVEAAQGRLNNCWWHGDTSKHSIEDSRSTKVNRITRSQALLPE